MALTNKDDQERDINRDDKEIFDELVKERFDETKELANGINQNHLIYYFKGNTGWKRFDDFNGIELFTKKSGELKLKEVKNACL